MNLPKGWRATASAVLLGISGLGLFGVTAFPTDPPLDDGTTGYTLSGQLHAVFGPFAFLTLIIGLFLLWKVLARDPRLQTLGGLTRWVAWLTIANIAAEAVAESVGFAPGLVARIFLPLHPV